MGGRVEPSGGASSGDSKNTQGMDARKAFAEDIIKNTPKNFRGEKFNGMIGDIISGERVSTGAIYSQTKGKYSAKMIESHFGLTSFPGISSPNAGQHNINFDQIKGGSGGAKVGSMGVVEKAEGAIEAGMKSGGNMKKKLMTTALTIGGLGTLGGIASEANAGEIPTKTPHKTTTSALHEEKGMLDGASDMLGNAAFATGITSIASGAKGLRVASGAGMKSSIP